MNETMVHTSLSGTVLCCFNKKSKSFPSQYSRTVQNLNIREDPQKNKYYFM